MNPKHLQYLMGHSDTRGLHRSKCGAACPELFEINKGWRDCRLARSIKQAERGLVQIMR